MTRLRDWYVPVPAEPTTRSIDPTSGGLRGAFDHAALRAVLATLTGPSPSDRRRDLTPLELWTGWSHAVDDVLGQDDLIHAVAAGARLSVPGCRAALTAVLEPSRAREALALLERGWQLERVATALLVVLPSTVPGIAAQVLLPALARGRPVLFKAASAEPWSAAALLEALARRVPALGSSFAAVCWRGGDREIEAMVAGQVGGVVAYGSDLTIGQWDTIDPQAVGFGHRASCAVVDATSLDPTMVGALVHDTVLLDQRGCLSLAGVIVIGTEQQGEAAAEALAEALTQAAAALPPGSPTPAELARVQQWRLTTLATGGRLWPAGSAAEGAVAFDPHGDVLGTPGLRHLMVTSAPSAAAALARLRESDTALQGVALAGHSALTLEPELRQLGATWTCAPGELQRPALDWPNAGIDPLATAAVER